MEISELIKVNYFTAMEGDNITYVFTEEGKMIERLTAEVIDGHYVLSIKDRRSRTFKVFGIEDEQNYLIAHSRLEEKAKEFSTMVISTFI
jgi:hypothetical protein